MKTFRTELTRDGKMRPNSVNLKRKQREEEIQYLLRNTGCLFLFYRQVKVEEKSPEVLQFEQQQRDEAESKEEEERERGGVKVKFGVQILVILGKVLGFSVKMSRFLVKML